MFRELTFPAFVRLSRVSRRASRRNTELGRMLQLGAVICAALSINTDITLIYQVFALLVCILIISRLALAIHAPQVSVKRYLPRYATAHESFEYIIEVTNEGDRVERDLTLTDNPIVIAPTIEQFRHHREPGEESRNAYDRWLGFHRFIWLQRVNTGVTLQPTSVADVPIKSHIRATIEATPIRRGVVHFESISVLHPDPFGLNHGVTTLVAPDQLLVLPRRYPVPAHFELPGGHHSQPGGVSTTWSIGESEEFVSLRDYRDGDSLRKIHWPSTARRTKPVVKEYQDEYLTRHALVLDNSSQQDEELEEAISVAASFVARTMHADAMLDLIYLAGKPEIVTAGRGASSATRQLETLAGLKRTLLPVQALSDAVLGAAHRESGYIVVLSNWCEVRRGLVETLIARGIPVKVLLVSSRHIAADLPPFVNLLTPGNIAEGLARL